MALIPRKEVLRPTLLLLLCCCILGDACFTSPSTKVTCACHTVENTKVGVCTLLGEHDAFPDLQHTDASYRELILRAGEGGARVATVDSQSLPGLELSTLRVEGIKIGFLDARAFLQVAGALYKLHLADNGLTSSNVSLETFRVLSQLNLLNITKNNLDPLNALFESNTNLQSLYLAQNGIVRVEDNVFSKLNSLRFLDLSDNMIELMTKDKLKGFANLKSLSIRSNSLNSLTKDAFMNVYNLETLDISHNDINTPAEDLFSRLANIKTIHMRNNSISQLPGGIFSNNPFLMTISLDHNNLESLDAALFTPCTVIQNILLSGNKLTSLPGTLFREYNTIQEIDLSGNDLESIPTGLFSGLSGLRRLYLNHNLLTSLPADLLSGLYDLLTLDIAHNKIFFNDLSGTYLPFRNMGKLTYLFLDNNRIATLPDNIFGGLENLDQLNMSSNGLVRIMDDSFISLVNLKKLDLSNNSLDGLPPTLNKDHLDSLSYLYMGGNTLQSFNFSVLSDITTIQGMYLDNCDLSEVTEDMFVNAQITILDLSQNSQLKLIGSPFRKLRNLRYLRMQSSGITSVSPDTFEGGFPSLLEINLSNNAISSLPEGVFTNLTSSPTINMTYNKMTSLYGGLGVTSGIITLDLRWNKVRCLSPTMQQDTNHVTYFLSHNPLQCGCYMVWARALASCATSNGACVRDYPTCSGSGGNALEVSGTACTPWKCPDPPKPRQTTDTSGTNVLYYSIHLIAASICYLFILLID